MLTLAVIKHRKVRACRPKPDEAPGYRNGTSGARNLARSRRNSRRENAAFATTLAKGLAVLEAFAPDSAHLGNTEIARRTGLSRPTVARRTRTLAELGYLAYEPSRAKFRLWARALTLAHPLLASMKLRQSARPLMQDLTNGVRGTVSIGLLDGTNLVYVESARATEMAAHIPDIGSTIPLPRAAMGRALLSMLDDPSSRPLRRDLPRSLRRPGEPIARRCATDTPVCEARVLRVLWRLGQRNPRCRSAAVSRSGFRQGLLCPQLRNSGLSLAPGELESDIAPRLVQLAKAIRILSGRVDAAANPATEVRQNHDA